MAMQKNVYGEIMTAFMRKKAYEEGIPIHAAFELTPRCGFDCRMCYVHLPKEHISEVGRGRELTADEWLDIGRQSMEMGVLSLCITGGDPVLHPEFKKIWTGLSRMGFRLTLQTNAAYLTEDVLKLLEEYPPHMVKITLYGSNDDVYREVCRVENGFTYTDKGIKALQERGFFIQLVTTVIRQNKEDVQKIADYSAKNKLPWYYSTACYPSLRGAESEAEECALDVWTLDCADETAKLWDMLPPMADEKVPGEKCLGYRTEFNISWDGYMRFCLLAGEPSIDVLEKDLRTSWNELLVYWKNLKWPEECYSCEYREKCKRCLAHLACLSGGFGKLNEEYCKQIKKMMDISERN